MLAVEAVSERILTMGFPSAARTVLVLDDDRELAEGLAVLLAAEGRRVITCVDIESSELVVENLDVSHILSDIRLTGPFGFEGLALLDRIRERFPACRIILMTGEASDELRAEAMRRGAADVLIKPFGGDALDPLLDPSAGGEGEIIRVPSLEEILENGRLEPEFQPLFDIASGEPKVAGYEALARLRDRSLLRRPDALFAYAERKRRVVDLDVRCLEAALRAASALPSDKWLFFNIHPAALGRGERVLRTLAEAASKSELAPQRLVLEITEQASLVGRDEAIREIESLSATGVRLALDDVGIAYSHLPLIDRIRPSLMKVSQEFGTSLENDPMKQKIVRSILSLSSDFGCELVIEGVETAETLRFCREIGAHYAQGYYLGRPARVDELLA